METHLKTLNAEMEKSLGSFKNELAKLRTGRASLNLLDDIRVDYYGTLTPINQVATMHVPESRLITIQPWEAKLIPEIEKAILKSGVGVTPINDGKMIRLNIPALNEERRKELVRMLHKTGEDAKVGLRNHRRDSMESLKKKHDAKELTEDEWSRLREMVQKVTDDYVKKIDQLIEHKEKDFLSV